MILMVVFDTFALVKFLKKESGYLEIAKVLEKGGYISEATLYELLYVTTRDFLGHGHQLEDSLRQAQKIIFSLENHLQKQAISDEIMAKATFFKIKYSKLNLSHFDCIALATAAVLGEHLFSGEKGLAQTKEVRVLG